MTQPIVDFVAAADQASSEAPQLAKVMASEIFALVEEGLTMEQAVKFVAYRWRVT